MRRAEYRRHWAAARRTQVGVWPTGRPGRWDMVVYGLVHVAALTTAAERTDRVATLALANAFRRSISAALGRVDL